MKKHYVKKYYELIGQRLVACVEWEAGYGSMEQARKCFDCEVREITKKEFDKLGEEYSSNAKK